MSTDIPNTDICFENGCRCERKTVPNLGHYNDTSYRLWLLIFQYQQMDLDDHWYDAYLSCLQYLKQIYICYTYKWSRTNVWTSGVSEHLLQCNQRNYKGQMDNNNDVWVWRVWVLLESYEHLRCAVPGQCSWQNPCHISHSGPGC